MKVYEVYNTFKAIHFKDRTILRRDLYLMSNDQLQSLRNLEIEPMKIGTKTRTIIIE